MKLSRRLFLTALGGTSLAGIASSYHMMYLEPSLFEVTEKDITLGHFQKPLRILHLSDFHASAVVPFKDIEKAIDISLGLDPDIAFLTGDYITWKIPQPEEYQRILKKLSAKIPTFACTGNHDGGKWAGSSLGYKDFSKIQKLLIDSDITFLFNESQHIKLHGTSMAIVGLGDYWNGDCHPNKILQKTRSTDEPIFVLSHNPDCKGDLKPYDWDLMCCGHTHGGQLVIPFLGLRPFLPVKDHSFPEGTLSWGNKHIHITRGIGNLHGMRFNCRPEISILNVS
ncbi:MAG: phosphodiesterase YaeI [Verrucomicrobiota bacterium]